MTVFQRLPLVALALVAGCGRAPADPRGVDRDEVLVQTRGSARAESRPDEARFSAGISSIDASATAATAANARKMNAIVAALQGQGVAEKDLQTRQLTVSRIDYGRNRGQFEANNVVAVRVRAIDKAGAAIAAATAAGANILSGPELRVGDPEAATRAAYGNAYKAARARADSYAAAAGLKVARILAIRDGGAAGPMMYDRAMNMEAVAQTVAPAPPPVMAGTSEAEVSVTVDFALGR